jgi:hypothetical protein
VELLRDVLQLVAEVDGLSRNPGFGTLQALRLKLASAVDLAPDPLPNCVRLTGADLPPAEGFRQAPFTRLIDDALDEVRVALGSASTRRWPV